MNFLDHCLTLHSFKPFFLSLSLQIDLLVIEIAFLPLRKTHPTSKLAHSFKLNVNIILDSLRTTLWVDGERDFEVLLKL